MTAPGRYCLAICYCRTCDHYQPLPALRDVITTPETKRTADTWADRDEPTWLDR